MSHTTQYPPAYLAFLERKILQHQASGFSVSDDALHPGNLPHQNVMIRWAARKGKALLAASFGLGKTRVQCELARMIVARSEGGKFLVVCPLGVRHQFMHEDGPALGMTWEYVRTDAEIAAATSPYLITNYERVRDGDITPAAHHLAGCSLDEGSVLRSLGSKTTQRFIAAFADVPYRYVATATPCPNDYLELINYADYLGVMDRGQALTRFFKRDSGQAGHLTLYQQHERDFWLWVASWALMVYLPSDLGCPDDGYVLPELRVHHHRVAVDHTRAFKQTDSRGQGALLLNAAAGVSAAAEEKRETLSARLEKLQEIMAHDSDGHWLLWHHLEVERKAIEGAVPTAVSVYGSQALDEREERILGMVRGTVKVLSTKPEIAGSGCNFQRHCHQNIFLGVDYRFQDFIQAVHRTYRFQQTQPVDVHLIYAESEDAVIETLMRKWAQHNEMVTKMRDIVREYGLADEALHGELRRSIGTDRHESQGTHFRSVHHDCVAESMTLPTSSVGLILTSIPFGNHYEYTVSLEDFGHNPSDAQFWEQMDFLIPQLLRVLKPGRVAAIHVKDRILYRHQTAHGMPEVGPFSDETVAAFRKHGWLYGGRRTILTDVVRENNGTYRLGYSEMLKDASKMGSGLPEYLLLFRKPPEESTTARADDPVTKERGNYELARWQLDAHAYWRSDGNGLLTPPELYDFEAHVQRLADLEARGNLPRTYFHEPPKSTHPWVWDDVVYMRTLNSNQSQSRRENHICPLPFDIVNRAIQLYSNEGDIVLDPFAGLHTVPMLAIQNGRYGLGIELNDEYWAAGVGYCRQADEERTAPSLFDYLELCGTVDSLDRFVRA